MAHLRVGKHLRVARTVAAIQNVTGTRPVGWHTRSPGSASTRRLLVDEGGFPYDSDAYNDDLPYFVEVAGKRHLVLPYAFDTNDMQFFHTNRFCGAGDFASYVIDAFDWLHREGAHAPKMMSIGLHLPVLFWGCSSTIFSLVLARTKRAKRSWQYTVLALFRRSQG
jgi:allantoinase